MKTALLICGKCPDNYKYFYDSIYKTLIEPFCPDVFISTWIEKDISVSDILNLYKPINSKFENFTDMKEQLNDFSNFLNDNQIKDILPSMFPMFYKLHNVNRLRLEYQKRSGIKYDLVIRTRFDLNFGEKMECSIIQPYVFNSIDETEIKDSIQNNALYLRLDPFVGNRVINDWIWDQFAFGNENNMDIYCNTFLNLKNILLSKRENVNINEKVLFYNLKDNNVLLKQTHTSYRISNYV
jgi:hypothetical protein